MATLLIRDVPDKVNKALAHQAGLNRRSREKQALHLLETSLAQAPVENCGELLEVYERRPAPLVAAAEIETYVAKRGRRSARP